MDGRPRTPRAILADFAVSRAEVKPNIRFNKCLSLIFNLIAGRDNRGPAYLIFRGIYKIMRWMDDHREEFEMESAASVGSAGDRRAGPR